MKQIEHTTHITVYEHNSELTPADATLLQRSRSAMSHSHSPYSHYPVGAALLLNDGTMVEGSNQENASFPLGLCAERTALANFAINHPGKTVDAIAVSVGSEAAAPCGMCRQALLEQESRQENPIRVLLKGSEEHVYEIGSIKELMPLPFYSKNLKKTTPST